eukprot:TRINITY_DN733_c0_g1_i12.p4 TRINITY_DN733_c0_g1~~TRINITY_DN733_c0_g1_i12.p4  ORF type:complete len:118 (+),score=8.63 TRINITY_DN733_c0_g1_i12:743-1096(+)
MLCSPFLYEMLERLLKKRNVNLSVWVNNGTQIFLIQQIVNIKTVAPIMKLKVPEIPKGIPSEKDPCPIGQMMNTAVAAATGAEQATASQGRIPKRKESTRPLATTKGATGEVLSSGQ